MIHSVFLANAFPPDTSVNKSKSKRENWRIMLIGGNTIYAGTENAQVEVGRFTEQPRCGRRNPPGDRGQSPYHCGPISPRIKSVFVCRFRMSANSSPRTSASAGNGREL